MILSTLTITKNQNYEANPDGYKGRLSFQNAYGTVELALNAETSAKILAVVAESVVESARDIATNLTAACLTVPALTNKRPVAEPVSTEDDDGDGDGEDVPY
jgi:hypothetical protein